MAILIDVQGNVSEVFPQDKKKFSLEELQKFVGGYIEAITFPDENIMFINEEGKLYNLPYNRLATMYVELHFPDFRDIIVGNAVICNRTESGDEDDEETL